MSTNVNRVGGWVKKGQKSVNIVCERPLISIVIFRFLKKSLEVAIALEKNEYTT